MNIFISTWVLLVAGLVFALPMIHMRVKETTEEADELCVLYPYPSWPLIFSASCPGHCSTLRHRPSLPLPRAMAPALHHPLPHLSSPSAAYVWLSTITLYLICRPPAPAFFNPSSALSSPVALADPMSLSHTSAHISYRRDEEKTQHGQHA